jgi:hypothetical protein
MPVEQVWKIAGECQKRLKRSSPRQLVKDVLAGLHQSWEDLAGLTWFDSLYRLRNCLVHRKGEVGVEDVVGEGQLSIIWRKISLKIDEDVVTSLPYSVEKGQELTPHFEDVVRTWRVGDVIEITPNDCQEMAISLGLFCGQVSERVHTGLRHFVPVGLPGAQ